MIYGKIGPGGDLWAEKAQPQQAKEDYDGLGFWRFCLVVYSFQV